MLDLRKALAAKPKPHDAGGHRMAWESPLRTPWGEQVERAAAADPAFVPLPEHPDPQFARTSFTVLNGWWECAFVDGAATAPASGRDVSCTSGFPDPATAVPPPRGEFDRRILVPFSPEAPLSGVGRQLQPHELLWYRRTLRASDLPELSAGGRMLLHFQAVDHVCACWVNGMQVGVHVGGYLPFTFDITDALGQARADGAELLLCVADPSEHGGQPRGKQRLDRGDIWYTAQSGIWQTVWAEAVPACYVKGQKVAADPETGVVSAALLVKGAPEGGAALAASLEVLDAAGATVAFAEVSPLFGEGSATFSDALMAEPARGFASSPAQEPAPSPAAAPSPVPEPSPAPDSSFTLAVRVPDAHLWSPDDPYLYTLRITYGRDTIESYCAFRSVEVLPAGPAGPADAAAGADDPRPRVFLNGRPLFLRGVLDQGYWPDGLLTAPSDEALQADIRAMRAHGFNLLRKHIKVESARWYYHADRLGMLVWQDMVNGGAADMDQWQVSYKPTLFRASWRRFRDDTPAHRESLGAGRAADREAWLHACRGTVAALQNHPCIVAWVLFNEGWGQFDARRACQMVRTLDPSRPIDATSGWYDQGCGDFASVHNYFRPLAVWPDRAARPARAFIVSEFGGAAFLAPASDSVPGGEGEGEGEGEKGSEGIGEAGTPAKAGPVPDARATYGYENPGDLSAWQATVRAALAQADALEPQGLAGFVYTQLSDVEDEVNGILSYDRRLDKLAWELGQPSSSHLS